MANPQWNLSWVNAQAAWRRLPTTASGTIDWGGIRVAHLDTGYTEHEVYGNWRPNGTNNTIVTRLGRDFFRRSRATAEDPLSSGFFLFPGHGTRSGSVLSGLDTAKAFSGVAPRLEVIPYRVTDSVIIDGGASRAVARAIIEVARRRRAKVVSISLGQLFPFKVIGEAVDLAYESGVIVVAAAGQKVDRVTYPGKHRRTIGVAGVTKRGKRFSIYNKYNDYARIDAWAPAKPIRRANYKADDRYGTGDGTTYATVHVAAAAAIWLRFHGQQVQQRYGNTWRRVEAFRQVLFASQKPLPFKVPDTNRAGRLDIDEILSQPLPDPALLQKEMDRAGNDIF